MCEVSEIVAGSGLPTEDENMFYRCLFESRAALTEYGIRGKSPEEALEMLQNLLFERGISVRKVVCSDAARLDFTSKSTGMTVRYDWEGPNPLENLLANKLLLPTVRKDPKLDSDFTIGEGFCECAGTLKERLNRFRLSALPYADSMELRTRRFRMMLEDVSDKAGLRFCFSYGMPVYYEEGRTPYSRTVKSVLRIEDRVSGNTLWEDSALVVDDGADIARMRSFRRLFEFAGLFGKIQTDGGVSIIERWDGDNCRGLEW